MLSALPLTENMQRPFFSPSPPSSRQSASLFPQTRRVYTFRHEGGSPSFRSVTGHTYFTSCTITVLRQYAPSTLCDFEARGIRFFGTGADRGQDRGQDRGIRDVGCTQDEADKEDEQDEQDEQDAKYFVLTLRKDSAPHPTLGEMFACDANFLQRAQASLEKVPNQNAPFC